MTTPRPARLTESDAAMLAHVYAREVDPAGRWDASAEWVWGGVWTSTARVASLRRLRDRGLVECGTRPKAGRDTLVRLTPRGWLTAAVPRPPAR